MAGGGLGTTTSSSNLIVVKRNEETVRLAQVSQQECGGVRANSQMAGALSDSHSEDMNLC